MRERPPVSFDELEAPFQDEHRCKPSPTEEVWVRSIRNSQRTTKGHLFSLEVLYSKDSGRTWEQLPMRLSPWARLKCIMLDGEWPPASASRNLSCDNGRISFEVIGADYWERPLMIWRATYQRAGNGGPSKSSDRSGRVVFEQRECQTTADSITAMTEDMPSRLR